MSSRKNELFHSIYERCYGLNNHYKLFSDAKGNLDLIRRMRLHKKLTVHRGCVNSICWNDTGQYILSGSDDQHLCITDGYRYKVLFDCATSHRANIFCAKFLPNTCDQKIISCSGDGMILYTDIQSQSESLTNKFTCHFGTTYEIATMPNDSNSFLSCGEDGTVRWFDLRTKQKCSKPSCKEDILIYFHRAVTSISVDPVTPYQLAVGCADGVVRIFDRRMLGTKATGNFQGKGLKAMLCRFAVPSFENQSHRITSLCHSRDGQEILDDAQGALALETCLQEGSKILSKRSKPTAAPPLKRLRLRGDWSDTGPNARPESESADDAGYSPSRSSLQSTLVQRMTNVVTRILNNRVVAMARRDGSEDSSSNESEELPLESTENNEADLRSAAVSVPPLSAELQNNAIPSINVVPEDSDPLAALHDLGVDISVDIVQSDLASNSENISQGESIEVEVHENSQLNDSNEDASIDRSNIESNNLQSEIDYNTLEVRENRSQRYVQSSSNRHNIASGLDRMSRLLQQPRGGNGTQRHTAFSREYTITNNPEEGNSDENISESSSDEEEDFIADQMRTRLEQLKLGPSKHCQSSFLLQPQVKKLYVGHRNARTMIKEAVFWGDKYVLSGSDCGHVFIWDRHTSEVVMLLEADQHVVNCIQPHPFDPVLATSGIDYDIKLWSPTGEDSGFNYQSAQEIIYRNKVMLEETKDTITVPASFMIRMIASLHQLRRVLNGRPQNVSQSNS